MQWKCAFYEFFAFAMEMLASDIKCWTLFYVFEKKNCLFMLFLLFDSCNNVRESIFIIWCAPYSDEISNYNLFTLQKWCSICLCSVDFMYEASKKKLLGLWSMNHLEIVFLFNLLLLFSTELKTNRAKWNQFSDFNIHVREIKNEWNWNNFTKRALNVINQIITLDYLVLRKKFSKIAFHSSVWAEIFLESRKKKINKIMSAL